MSASRIEPVAINPLIVAPGPTHIVILTADGARSHGLLHRHNPDALRNWDVWLDSLDAANEGPDGRIA